MRKGRRLRVAPLPPRVDYSWPLATLVESLAAIALARSILSRLRPGQLVKFTCRGEECLTRILMVNHYRL